jgi:hypothetical protein
MRQRRWRIRMRRNRRKWETWQLDAVSKECTQYPGPRLLLLHADATVVAVKTACRPTLRPILSAPVRNLGRSRPRRPHFGLGVIGIRPVCPGMVISEFLIQYKSHLSPVLRLLELQAWLLDSMQMRARHNLHPENTKLGLPRGNHIPATHRRVETKTQILPRMRRRNNAVVL